MEDENKQDPLQSPDNQPSRTRVGFPQAREEKKSPIKLILIILVVLAVLGGIVWYLFGRKSLPATDEVTPTSFIQQSTPIPTPTEEPIERSGVSIQILNGTGIAKAAASLQEKLQELGYTEFELGNASSQNYKSCEVTFDTRLPQSVQDEILELLQEIYQDVESSTESLDEFDVKIITGYPRGYTPTPTQRPTSTPAAKLTPSSTGTVTPSPSAPPTPTI